jgi:hypothetical protein
MAKVPGGLWQNIIAVQVYGANTGVGKTVFSTLLGAHFLRRSGRTRWALHYVKPVSTGPEDEADDAYVALGLTMMNYRIDYRQIREEVCRRAGHDTVQVSGSSEPTYRCSR